MRGLAHISVLHGAAFLRAEQELSVKEAWASAVRIPPTPIEHEIKVAEAETKN